MPFWFPIVQQLCERVAIEKLSFVWNVVCELDDGLTAI
jgi:hypothetical protein